MAFIGGKHLKPGLDHVCLGMENFEPDGIMKRLVDFGLKEQIGDPPGGGASSVYGLSGPLMTRAFARSGGRDNRDTVMTVEVFVTDPDNITVQLNDVNYCSGFGRLGIVCP